MGECLQLGESTVYQPLKGLQDIKCLHDLTEDNIRDILRGSLRDDSLTVTKLGELTDMSGTNDAFNSSICSLEVTVEFNSKVETTDEGVQGRETKAFNFVVKSPPKASFVRLSHKMSKPFLNEVTWYLEMLKQIEFVEKDMTDSDFKISNLGTLIYPNADYYDFLK
ncbi:uncharacterized protein LOC111710385 [Eurytemora carolleeae]|uniref:uncharacterized protein LOC111710385 n=1 Tax=Eurytemora carolleeae TaxID=1294199 RepID=UPI000C769249|nr:uncharacterized protein LOC111710385 [Eurytemora carolleeae]|eukprot:XP_023340236.1 uncharacterized protein LOC111710385 [Eurytemora affinis]